MNPSLLSTKFFFPKLMRSVVYRQRLLERIEVGLKGPLTLVSAPAGYGKSTLLGQWRKTEGKNYSTAWLALDQGDNDLDRFLLYLAAAFDTVQPQLTGDLGLLLKSAQLPPVEAIATVVINALAGFDSDLVLVLDDYHLISNSEVHDLVSFLLEHSPPHLHFVILTRSDPPLPLARLRARGQLTEIRAADLRFISSEAQHFLNEKMGLHLGEKEISALEIRTEGWIAGLQLAALSMQGREDIEGFIQAFSGSHQYIVDYLVEEVLNRQDENVQEFLLKTSILERFTGSLCDALTGNDNGQDILEFLSSSNLFLISLDDERIWFRYHHLFADILRNRLRNKYPDLIADLHRRASAWFDGQQMPNEAIDEAFAAQDFWEGKRLMRAYFPEWWQSPNWRRVFIWFDHFPLDFLKAEPWLCVVYAWMIWSKGKLEETEKYLVYAQAALDDLVSSGNFPTGDLEYEGLGAEILAFRALITTQKGDPENALELANQALTIAPEEAATVRAVAYSALQIVYRNLGMLDEGFEALHQGLIEAKKGGQVGVVVSTYQLLGTSLLILGRLDQAIQTYREALEFLESIDESDLPAYGLIQMRLADVFLQRDLLEEAETLLNQALERADFFRSIWGMIYGRSLLCQIQIARGDLASAKQICHEVDELKPNISGAYFKDELIHFWIVNRIRLGLGKAHPDEDWFDPRFMEEELTITQFERVMDQVHGLVLMGKVKNLTSLLEKLQSFALEKGLRFWSVKVLVLQALVWKKLGDQAAALEFLKKAVILAEGQRIMRVFLNEGEEIQDLLMKLQFINKEDSVCHFVDDLLAAFAVQNADKPSTEQSLISPLSDRELEVLSLIARGCSNKEIAGSLIIAVGTVKRHTVNIFNKLDVKNRTEAVAKSRELNLID